jgi:uncharacterized protein
MTTRRTFLATLLAAGAARETDDSFALYGVGADGTDRFRIALPARAHAGAVHPSQPLAFVFVRRTAVPRVRHVFGGWTDAVHVRMRL